MSYRRYEGFGSPLDSRPAESEVRAKSEVELLPPDFPVVDHPIVSHRVAIWRELSHDDASGRVSFSFFTDSGPIGLTLSVADALNFVDALSDRLEAIESYVPRDQREESQRDAAVERGVR